MAGLACALAAARAGASVALLEARTAASGLPAHVDVVPNMLRDLVRLGVGEDCIRAGFAYRRSSAIGQRGQPLYAVDAERLAGPRYPAAIGITHAELHRVLAAAALEAGVRLHVGTPVEGVADDGAALLQLANGEQLRADLAVLACGAHSRLRERVFREPPLAASGAEWIYFLAPRPAGLDDALHAGTATGDKAHVVPVSGAFAGVRLSARHAPADLGAAAARQLLARFPGPVGALAADVPEDQPIARRVASPGLLRQPWARGCVLAAGDCAHAFPPHFGQSAAQAVEDAVVLGELLSRPEPNLPEAWLQRRSARVQQVMAIALQAARWDAAPDSDTDLLQLARALDQVVRQPA
ncbi:hypothetical protein HHL11_25160 [Ramlibacter sp. G-1-2-2]|uniref:FAD-binding domain-containing protein n=1 Tax=Ramlibacter agri TaxID=2728837 RepID=A0A848HC41_9BURK|nr:hypothetical protein [Ramlibacter agri]